MSFLEYATLTVTTLRTKYLQSFLDVDEAWKAIRAAGKKQPAYGPKFRFRRVKGTHSEASEITDTNLTVNLNRSNVFDYVEGDWPKIIQPIILPHPDRDRFENAAEAKQWVAQNTRAALAGMSINIRRRFYNGGGKTTFKGFCTLLGSDTGGTRTGFQYGALMFATPAAQQASAQTWLGLSRRIDTTNFVDNWYNQYKQHTGIGVDFIDSVREVKAFADSFTGDGDETGGEMNMGIMGISDHIKLSKEIRTTPGGGASLVYTVEDIKAGRVMPNVEIAAGVRFYSNRWMDPTVIGVTEPCYLITPESFEWWVWAKNDFRVTPFKDGLEVGNVDADFAFIITSFQMAPVEPLRNGCVGQ